MRAEAQGIGNEEEAAGTFVASIRHWARWRPRMPVISTRETARSAVPSETNLPFATSLLRMRSQAVSGGSPNRPLRRG